MYIQHVGAATQASHSLGAHSAWLPRAPWTQRTLVRQAINEKWRARQQAATAGESLPKGGTPMVHIVRSVSLYPGGYRHN